MTEFRGTHRVESGDFTEAGGRRAMERLIEDRPDLDAVFASSDKMAVGAKLASMLPGTAGLPHREFARPNPINPISTAGLLTSLGVFHRSD